MTSSILAARVANIEDHAARNQIQRRWDLLSSAASLDGDRAAVTWPLMESRKQSEEIAKTHLARTEDARREGNATDADVEAAKQALARERSLTAKAQAEVSEIQTRAFDAKAVVEAVERHLAGLPWPTTKRPVDFYEPKKPGFGRPKPPEIEGLPPAVELVTPKLPEGELRSIIAAKCTEIGRVRTEIELVDDAPDRLESAERRLPALVDDLAARGAPVLVGAGERGGRLKIEAPRIDIGAGPGLSAEPGHIPRAHDALALAAWLAPDRVLEKLRTDLAESYIGVEIQLDPHEKSRRKRELKAAILRAERVECAAIWALIEAGDDSVRFRPDTDPRAVLGIR